MSTEFMRKELSRFIFRFRLLLVLACWFVGFVSCITPPDIEMASVLPQQELEVISLIKRGKDYAQAGRNDLAEEQFRLALRKRLDVPTLYNDLAFVVQAQDRPLEAKALYEKALYLSPNNFIARDNYARLLYQLNYLEESLLQYETMIDLINRFSPSELNDWAGQSIDNADLIKIYRDKATVYYAIGSLDEALCYAKLAYFSTAGLGEAARLVRLLILLGKYREATTIIRQVMQMRGGVVPGNLLLDYGIASYCLGEQELARTAISRVLSLQNTDRITLKVARLLGLIIAINKENRKEADNIYTTLFEEEPRLCQVKSSREETDYWPQSFAAEVQSLLNKLCDDENKSVFKSWLQPES